MTINLAISLPTNPGTGIRSMIAISDDGEIVYSRAQVVADRAYTNNEFAYRTLLAALVWAQRHTSEAITIRTDQELLFRQIRDEWECRSERLRPLMEKAKELLSAMDAQLLYIPIRENVQARSLCSLATNQTRNERRAS
jgi:ribonuclease HI